MGQQHKTSASDVFLMNQNTNGPLSNIQFFIFGFEFVGKFQKRT
jgi:hypothetical protein